MQTSTKKSKENKISLKISRQGFLYFKETLERLYKDTKKDWIKAIPYKD